MGCDIHAFVEYTIDPDGGSHDMATNVWFDRDYGLFALLAGVRGRETDAMIPPRGLPDNLSDEVRIALQDAPTEPHTPSWLTLDEVSEIARRYGRNFDLDLVLAMMRQLTAQGRAPRLVFWFDN